MICLTHIPKTGGTTFRNILINNFTWGHVDFPNFPKDIICPTDYPLNSKSLKYIKSLSGHRLRYSDELKTSFPDFKFIVFLREPISRIISLFLHIQRYEDPELQFSEWVLKNCNTPLLSNSQTLFVAGKEDLGSAIEIVTNKYLFAGSMEKFDESLLMLKKIIGGNFNVHYVRKNVAQKNKNEIIDDNKNASALQKLYEHNALDIELYNYVTESLWPEYKIRYGGVSAQDLLLFKDRNQLFRPNSINKNIFRIVKYLYYENMFRFKR